MAETTPHEMPDARPRRVRRLRIRAAFSGIYLVPLTLIWAPGLWRGDLLLYRDAAHYYLPLYHYVQEQWRRGEIPLWSPHEALGRPLLADPTAAVMYPPRLMLCAFDNVAVGLNSFVLAHFIIAGMGVVHALRSRRVSGPASGLAATAYTLSGSVLVQHANVPYLIGAAWLPWGMSHLDRFLRAGRTSNLLGLSACWSLMILGGDFQTAYHLGLLGFVYVVILGRAADEPRNVRPKGGSSACESPAPSPDETTRRRLSIAFLRAIGRLPIGARRVGRLAAAALLAVALSAVQVIPSATYGPQTDRVDLEHPVSIYQWLAARRSAKPLSADVLWHRPDNAAHAERIYRFSLAPARIVELLVPGVAGRPYPVNSRWFEWITGREVLWTPSLYFGVAPLLLAAVSMRWRGNDRFRSWLTWSAVLSVLASFGGYGAVWIVQQIAAATHLRSANLEDLHPAAGGLYWWMVMLLPGYGVFRYPSKWLVPATLSLSLLAGLGADRVARRPARIRPLALRGMLAVPITLLAALLVGWPWVASNIATLEADRVFGPVNTNQVWRDVVGGCVQGILVIVVLWRVVRLRTVWRRARAVYVAAAIALLTAADLWIANRWIVQFGPRHLVMDHSEVDHEWPTMAQGDSRRYYRPTAHQWRPERWRQTSDVLRLQQVVRWDRETFFPKYPLQFTSPRLSAIAPGGSATDRRLARLLYISEDSSANSPISTPHREVLRRLACRFWIMPASWRPPAAYRQHFRPVHDVPDGSVWEDTQAYPLAWLTAGWQTWTPGGENLHAEPQGPRPAQTATNRLETRLRELFTSDLRDTTWIEGLDVPLAEGDKPAGRRAQLEWLEQSPGRLRFRVASDRTVCLVINQQYDPGWRCRLRQGNQGPWRGLHVLRANYVMQAVIVPAGVHELRLEYRPWAG